MMRTTRGALGRLLVLPADLIDGWRDPDRLLPPRSMRFVGDGDFQTIGAEFLGHFVTLGGLQPRDRVLDIGCGVGRMALPLTTYLDASACYDGFDAVKAGIDWCQRRMTPRFPNFTFHHADVYSHRYNRSGRYAARDFRFPLDDASVDFAFATSVFTHLLPDAAQHYLAEMARVLRPGGHFFGTYFLLNPEVVERMLRGATRLDFNSRNGCYVADEDVPENAVAYEQSGIERWYRANALVTLSVHGGSWAGHPNAPTFQDIVVAKKDG